MDYLMLGIGCFSAGFACGGMLLAYQAIRPQGYLATNGKRFRLVEVHAAGQ